MRSLRNGLLALAALGAAVQVVPYGRAHENPAVLGQPPWDRGRTRELFFRACGNCHSNESRWPWYASVAPVSWLVQYDVEEARSHFNVSEWGRPENHADEAAERVREGEMPPWYYLPLHRESRLSERERDELIAGLVATFGEADSHHGHAHEH